MSKDQPQSRSPADNDHRGAPGNSGLDEDRFNMNLFASVWVKIEVNEEDDAQVEKNPVDQKTKTNPQKRGRKPGKRRDPRAKNFKCDQCDYTTNLKNSLAIHLLGHTDEKPFTCTQCDYKTRYLVSLKRHIFVKHEHFETKDELPTYNCTVCAYKTHFKWNLSAHKRKHDLAKQYQCPKCSYSTAYKHNIMKHGRTHDKPEESTYYCDKCPFATKYEGHIARHLAKLHFEVSDTANRCEFCSFSTKTGWRLNIHKKRSCQDKTIKCAHCDFETMYRCAFKEHRLTHTEVSKNNQQWLHTLFTDNNQQIQQDTKEDQSLEIMKMCEIRSKIEEDAGRDHNESTKIFNDLKNKLNEDTTYYTINNDHQVPSLSMMTEKNNHYHVDPDCEVSWNNIQVIESPNQDRPFQCITCNYRAKFKASVQRHYQRHHTSQNRPYKCVNCDFSTKTKDQINLHNKRSKSDEILICKICAFTSVFKCQFMMHEKAHYPFKCVHCEYTCKKKAEIQKHFTIVHLGNGLKCSHCDYKASRKESLLCHEVIHTGKKPFQCLLCPYSSVRKSLLESHMTRFHNTRVAEKIIDYSKIKSLKRKTVESETDKIEDYYTTISTSVSN